MDRCTYIQRVRRGCGRRIDKTREREREREPRLPVVMKEGIERDITIRKRPKLRVERVWE